MTENHRYTKDGVLEKWMKWVVFLLSNDLCNVHSKWWKRCAVLCCWLFFLLNSICKCQEVVFEHKWILVCVLQLVRFTMTGKWGLILVTSQARLGYLRFLDSLTVLEGNAQWSFFSMSWISFVCLMCLMDVHGVSTWQKKMKSPAVRSFFVVFEFLTAFPILSKCQENQSFCLSENGWSAVMLVASRLSKWWTIDEQGCCWLARQDLCYLEALDKKQILKCKVRWVRLFVGLLCDVWCHCVLDRENQMQIAGSVF